MVDISQDILKIIRSCKRKTLGDCSDCKFPTWRSPPASPERSFTPEGFMGFIG